MHIQLNGEQHELPSAATVANLIESLGLTGRRLAIEVNEDIVPRSLHSEHQLSDGDRVEVVHAIGGG